MRGVVALAVALAVALFPWVLWALLRSVWYRIRERQVLQSKYGDLEMFRARLREWGLKPPRQEE